MRYATIHDKEKIIDLLKEFAIGSHYPMAQLPLMWSKTYIENALQIILNGRGYILLNDAEDAILIAVKMPSFWVPTYIQLQEVMLHAKSKQTMVKLIKEYVKLAKKLVQQGEIHEAVLACNTDANLSKLGLSKFENNWRVK